ncbi:UNVERIFIED_CONTAM: hypothetical protein GTU68_005955 [Idotea baltica]|nr:hypothetical protein [Idotea baltica]
MSTLLEVSSVSVTFDGFRAINNLSIQIAEPELRAVIGPNGAGKTTFMDIVTGKTKPDTGHVIWGERNISLLGMSESQIAMAGIGRKFQKPTVFEGQTVRENLAMALKNPRGTFAVLRHKKTAKNGERINEIALEIGLQDDLTRLAGVLSHGQKQWLEIGMLLAQDPRLLLVDEPAAGMTAQEREKTTDILKRAAQTRAVVVVEHDMEFVRRLDCKVTVLHEGSVLAEGSLDHVTKNADRNLPDTIFELFPVLQEMLGRRGGDLSGGQQQQLAIARALITRPKVLLLDEPTEGIQPNIIQQIGRAIETLRKAGNMAIILVEQNLDFAYQTADRFVIMKRGEVCDRFDKSASTKADLIGALAL